MNLPNKLSLTRILITPLIIIIELFPYHIFGFSFPLFTISDVTISLKNIIILIIFLFGCFTDYLDGHIARRDNLVTSFGKFIDPIADKALINTLLVLLCYNRVIPVLPVLIMILRDLVVDGCRLIAGEKGTVISANIYGKVKTVSQMICIIFSLLNNFPFEAWDFPISSILVWFTAFISIFSGIHYYNEVKDFIFESK